MTSKEVITKLEEIKNDKIAEAAMDSDYANLSIYGDVFNAAIEALQSPQAKQESAMLLAGHNNHEKAPSPALYVYENLIFI